MRGTSTPQSQGLPLHKSRRESPEAGRQVEAATLLDIGYQPRRRSRDLVGGGGENDNESLSGGGDNQEQVDYYEAVPRILSTRPWMAEVFVWDTSPGENFYEDPSVGVTSDIEGQPVEELIRIWFDDPN